MRTTRPVDTATARSMRAMPFAELPVNRSRIGSQVDPAAPIRPSGGRVLDRSARRR